MKKELTGYDLSRQWFDWCYENPSKISVNHTALYFFIIEHCNRLGWKEEFGLPMEMAKDALGIKNYRTYSNTFNDLVDWGFIEVRQKSKNQYSANIIAIVENTKATTKALSKAMQKHSQKQRQGNVGIDKPITIKPKKPITPPTEFSSEYLSFIKKFNEATGKKFLGDKESFKNWMKINESGITQDELIIATTNCKNTEFHQKPENKHFLTPSFITRTDKFQTYFNATPVNTTRPPSSISNDLTNLWHPKD